MSYIAFLGYIFALSSYWYLFLLGGCTISLCTSVALGCENLSICLQDGQFVYKTGRGPTTNILVYLCGVRARKSVNLFTRRAICLQDGEGSNDNNNNDNLAFPRGGPERGNPAMTTKRLRQGVKETHQHKCCGKNTNFYTS